MQAKDVRLQPLCLVAKPSWRRNRLRWVRQDGSAVGIPKLRALPSRCARSGKGATALHQLGDRFVPGGFLHPP
eukprot:10132191-Alexandrium_andersonii.AAC.1